MAGKLDEDDKFDWTKGKAEGSPLPPNVSEYLQQVVFPCYFQMLDDEENKETVEKVLECLRELGEDLGPAAYNGYVAEKLMKYIILFLDKKAYC